MINVSLGFYLILLNKKWQLLQLSTNVLKKRTKLYKQQQKHWAYQQQKQHGMKQTNQHCLLQAVYTNGCIKKMKFINSSHLNKAVALWKQIYISCLTEKLWVLLHQCGSIVKVNAYIITDMVFLCWIVQACFYYKL